MKQQLDKPRVERRKSIFNLAKEEHNVSDESNDSK
jgi:hypothetical protein